MQQLHGPDNNIPIRTPRKNTFTLSLEHRSSPFHTLLREQYDYGTSPTKKTCRLSLASSSLRQQWQRVQSAQTRLDRQRDIVRSRHHPYQNSISRHPPSFSSRLSRSSAIFHMGRTKLESLLLSRVGFLYHIYQPTTRSLLHPRHLHHSTHIFKLALIPRVTDRPSESNNHLRYRISLAIITVMDFLHFSFCISG